MTISWADVQNAVKQAVVDTASVPAASVAWDDEQRPAAKMLVILSVVYAQLLQDRETVTPHDPEDGGFDWALSSLYYLRIQVRVESIFSAPGSDALFTLEKIRAGLLRPDVELGAEIILQPDNSTYVHHLSYPFDGRIVNAYALEFGVRGVIDFALTGTIDAAPNMTRVEIDAGEIEVGEPDPVEMVAAIDRP